MLVFTRKLREAVVIGADSDVLPGITITVLEVRGGKVKHGFTADPGISIQRSEVWERIHTGDSSARNEEELGMSESVVMPGGLFLTGASARLAGISFKEEQL